jgi:hypothetical protein
MPVFIVNLKSEGGADYITDTAAHTGPYESITALAAAVVSVATSDNIGGTLTSIPIPAGVTIFGHFASITLASGTVIAYKSA